MKQYLLLSLLFLSTAAFAGEEDYYKELRRSFAVNKNVSVHIQTDFAEVNVETWDQAQMDVLVQVNADAKSDSRGQEILDKVMMSLQEGREHVDLSVRAENLNCRSGESFQVTIYLKMPVGGSLGGGCTFGNVHLANLNGPCALRVEYGDLTAGDLNGKTNDIHAEFGDVRMGNFGGGRLTASYGNADVRRISGDATVRCDFGDLRVDQVDAGCKSLNVTTEYGDQKLVFANNASFSFTASADFGDVKVTGTGRTSKEQRDYTSSRITGTIGSGSGTMTLTSSFGDIRIE